MAMRYVTTNIRFDPEDYADLQRLAAASGSSLAACVRMAVGAYLGRPEPAGEAGEARPQYGRGLTPIADLEPESAAVVKGRTLLLEEPLPGFCDGARVWIRYVGEAEMAQRRRYRQTVAELLTEFEALSPGAPGPVGDDDKEIYQP